LAYADGRSSGIRIEPMAQTAIRQFNPCEIQRIQTLTVGVCIAHPDINELNTQLVFPNGTTQNVSLQNVSNTCPGLIGGQLFQTILTSNNLPSLQSSTGNWSLKVSDNNPITTTIGSLVGWSLRAEGL
jgi:subtilisin-like proprotein convertase family protein